MATTFTHTTTYAGEAAVGYLKPALFDAPSIFNGGVTVKPNVKFKEVIRRINTNDLLANASCDFTPTSTITLDEKILTPKQLMVNLQLCKLDFYNSWEAMAMGASSLNDNLPPSFEDYLLQHVAEKVAQRNEELIWQGVEASAGQFGGLLANLAADGTVVDVTATTVTSSNVIAELQKVVAAIPKAVRFKSDLFIYVPANVLEAYIAALGGYGANGLGANGTNAQGTQWYTNEQGMTFGGIKLFYAPGLPSDTMVAAQSSNLFFGTGLVSDHSEAQVIDMSQIDGSKNVNVIMRFSAGVQVGWGAEVVLYS